MSDWVDQEPGLRCSSCGEKPGPDVPAKAGGTHYVSHTRVSGIGQKPFTRVVSCGRWERMQAREPGEEG
jgi:hypothetical protein